MPDLICGLQRVMLAETLLVLREDIVPQQLKSIERLLAVSCKMTITKPGKYMGCFYLLIYLLYLLSWLCLHMAASFELLHLVPFSVYAKAIIKALINFSEKL